MGYQVANIRTGELENCNVGATCQRHLHPSRKFNNNAILDVTKSLEEDEATLDSATQSTARSFLSRFKAIFIKAKVNPVDSAMEEARQKLLDQAKSIIGMTGHQLNVLETFSSTKGNNGSNKGHLGNVIQENVFGIPANSTPEPDFVAEGLELKVIGVKKKNDGTFVAKERMVANIIDFDKEDLSGDIKNSSFWKKNQRTLVIMYEHVHKDQLSNKIIGAFILDLNTHPSYTQIAEDYKVINNKIKNGKAESISGGDTHFLEACTKGSGHGRDLRSQPFSNAPAKQRAYALKPRFMNSVISPHVNIETL